MKMMEKKVFLLTNDDGIDAPGIKALEESLKQLGEVFVSAPASEMSGVSQSITIRSPLKTETRDSHHTVVHGTPADCISFALRYWISPPPDAVISGINFGANLGEDVVYSGTVAGAREGCMYGITSLAISLAVENWLKKEPNGSTNFQAAANRACRFIPEMLSQHPSGPALFNMNCPNIGDEHIRGYRTTKLSSRFYQFDKEDTDDSPVYHLGNTTGIEWKNVEGSDFEAVRDRFVSITQLPLNASVPISEELSKKISNL